MKIILPVLIAFLSVNVFSQDLSEGLLIDYKFDGNADDSSEGNYHGLNYRVNYGSDRYGNAFSAAVFNGIDSYIDFPNKMELKPELPVSFAFWVNYNDLSYENSTVFNTSFEEDVNSGVYMNVQSSTSKYQISFGDGTNFYSSGTRRTFTSDFSIQPSEWHQIIIVLNGASDVKMYVDCEETFGSYSGSGGELKYSNLPGSIGRHDRSLVEVANYFKGVLDDFRYWNRALTDDEINLLCKECNHLSVADTDLNPKTSIIFPQPADGFINIKANRTIDEIVILNSMGELVMAEVFKPHIDLAHLTSGIYFVKLISESQVETKKIIIK